MTTSRQRYNKLMAKHTSGWAKANKRRAYALGQCLLLTALELDYDATSYDCADPQGTTDRATDARSTADRYL